MEMPLEVTPEALQEEPLEVPLEAPLAAPLEVPQEAPLEALPEVLPEVKLVLLPEAQPGQPGRKDRHKALQSH